MHKHPLTSLRGWLFLLFLGTTLGFLIIGGLGVLGSHHGSTSLQSLYHGHVIPLRQLKALGEYYGSEVQNVILRLDAGELTTDEGIAQIRTAQDSATHHWTNYRAGLHDSSSLRLLTHLDTALLYANMEIDNTLRYLEIQSATGNRMLANRLYPIVGSLNPSVRPVSAYLDTLSNIHLQRAHNEYKHEDKRAGLYLFITLLVVAAGMAIGPVVGLRTLQRINSQIGSILPALSRISQGDLQVRIDSPHHDELSLIADGINRMTQSLREIVAQTGSDSITLSQTSVELTTLARHALDDAKAHVQQTKQTAAIAQEIALRLESGIELLNAPVFAPDSPQRLRSTLLTLRNENMVSVVRGLANTRATASQSARNVDLLRHKAQVLAQMSDQLSMRMRLFQTEQPVKRTP
jgi:methyl-accepting chemotaxis protein